MDPRAPGLAPEAEDRPEVRHGARALGEARADGLRLAQPPLDPGPQLGHSCRGLALARPRGEHDLDAGMGVDPHTDALCAR